MSVPPILGTVVGSSGPWREKQIPFPKGMLGWPRAQEWERWWKRGGGGGGAWGSVPTTSPTSHVPEEGPLGTVESNCPFHR